MRLEDGTVEGRLIELDEHDGLHLDCGDYGKDAQGQWVAYAPEPRKWAIDNDGNLIGRATPTYLDDVTVHQDGTISVAERTWSNGWHGKLDHGEWVD